MTNRPLMRSIILLASLLATTGAQADDSSVVSGDLESGDTFTHTFQTTGTFDYHCHPHPWMAGAITIEPADGDSDEHTVRIVEGDPSDADSWVFEPAEFTIRSGDTVTWINEGEQTHTIMGGVGGAVGPVHDDTHDHAADDHDAPGIGTGLMVAIIAGLVLVRRK